MKLRIEKSTVRNRDHRAT